MKAAKPIKIQLKVYNLCTPSHFLKLSSGQDESLGWANSGPRALCLIHLHSTTAPSRIAVKDPSIKNE